MNDLVTAVDAALAIEAGKYVVFQLGRSTLTRLLTARFGDIAAPDTDTAKQRLGGFLRNLDARTAKIDNLSRSRLEEQFAKPEVTAAFYDALQTAMETDDPLKQDTLADLVVARLRAPDESVDGPAARIATERLRDVTPHQLRLLAFIGFLFTDWTHGQWQWNTIPDDQKENYVTWLAHMAKPFDAFGADFGDFSHLRSLGLLNFNDALGAFTTSSTPPAAVPAFLRFQDILKDTRVKPILALLTAAASGDPRRSTMSYAATTTLTPAGHMIAQSALRSLTDPAPPLAAPPGPNALPA